MLVVHLVLLGTALFCSAAAAGGGADPCAAFDHCSQCLYDAYDTEVSIHGYKCSWCEGTAECTSNATDCGDVRAVGGSNDHCDGMSCGGAEHTGNLYLCRGMTIAALSFAVLLALLCAPYALWAYGLQLQPWRYANADAALAEFLASVGGLAGAVWRDPQEFIVLQERAAYCSPACCPSCRVTYAGVTFPPGRVCFWCDIARRAPLPLFAAVTASLVSIALIFGVSMQPDIADVFYSLLLTAGYAVPAVFIGGILTAHSSQKSRSSLWITWGLAMRFRGLRSCFGVDAAPEVDLLAHSDDDTILGAGVESQSEIMSPGINPSVPDVFQHWVTEQLRPDEELLWWDQPNTSTVLVHHAWMIICYALGIAVGVFLIMLGQQPAAYYSRLLPSSGLLDGLGLGLVLLFTVLLGLITASRTRLYMVTSKRLVMLSPGPLANVNVIATPLSSVTAITLEGYQFMGHSVASLRWEVKSQDGRQMPPCRMQYFPAVGHVESLMRQVLAAVPTQCREAPRAALAFRQLGWYVKIQCLMFAFVLLPLLFLGTGVFTWFLGNVGFNLLWGIIGSLIVNNGWVTIATTIANDKMAHQWDEASRRGFSLHALGMLSVADVLPTLRPDAPCAGGDVELQ